MCISITYHFQFSHQFYAVVYQLRIIFSCMSQTPTDSDLIKCGVYFPYIIRSLEWAIQGWYRDPDTCLSALSLKLVALILLDIRQLFYFQTLLSTSGMEEGNEQRQRQLQSQVCPVIVYCLVTSAHISFSKQCHIATSLCWGNGELKFSFCFG